MFKTKFIQPAFDAAKEKFDEYKLGNFKEVSILDALTLQLNDLFKGKYKGNKFTLSINDERLTVINKYISRSFNRNSLYGEVSGKFVLSESGHEIEGRYSSKQLPGFLCATLRLAAMNVDYDDAIMSMHTHDLTYTMAHTPNGDVDSFYGVFELTEK